MNKDIIHVTDTVAGITTHRLRSDGGRQIKWVSADGTVRIPEERKINTPYPGFYKAAGKIYVSLKDLCKEQDDSGCLCRDVYGREVLYMAERFPCFDSYDYLYETRKYHWYFIKEGGKLTRIYHADGSGTVQVTEDVRDLENKCIDQMKALNWLE